MIGVVIPQVVHRPLERALGTNRCVVRNLRFVGAAEVRGGVDDRLVEGEYRIGFPQHNRRQAAQVRVKANAEQGGEALPAAQESVFEAHGAASIRIVPKAASHELTRHVTGGRRTPQPVDDVDVTKPLLIVES